MKVIHYTRFVLCILILTIAPTSHLCSQEERQEKEILIVPGDIRVPYEVVNAIAFVIEVEASFSFDITESRVQRGYNETLQKAFDTLEKFARKANADAVVNLQLQFVAIPFDKAAVHELLIYGTLVKYTGK